MKFQELLDRIAETVPVYRRTIFKTIMLGLVVCNGDGMISAIFRRFAALFAGTNITRKRFYTFLNSGKIAWAGIWRLVADQIRDFAAVDGRLLLAVDDTTYGKTGRKISGCSTHHDHAAKKNASRWIYGHCRVMIGTLLRCHGR